MIPKAKLDAIRAMYADWWAGILGAVDPNDDEALSAHTILTGALVGFVPELLDELERLQARQPEPAARIVKFSAHGGHA